MMLRRKDAQARQREADEWVRDHTKFPDEVGEYLNRANALPGLNFAVNTLGDIGDDNVRRMKSSPVSHAIRVSNEGKDISDGKRVDPDPRIDHNVFRTHTLAAQETMGRFIGALLNTPGGKETLERMTAANQKEVREIELK